MNIELTTTKLSKLCGICLSDGEFNIWKYKVKLPSYDAKKEDDNLEAELEECEPVNGEVTVHEMLQIFDKWQEFDNQLHSICHICLQEFLSCYIFYKKLKKANAQAIKLYKEALELETANSEPEQVEYLDDLEIDALAVETTEDDVKESELIENTPHTFYLNAKSELESNADLKEFAETHSKLHTTKNSLPEVSKVLAQTQKHKMIKNPKFILTGGVTQLLTRATNKRVSTSMNSPRKRQKTNKINNTEEYANDQAVKPSSLDDPLIVVTQFIPTSSAAQEVGSGGGGDHQQEKFRTNALCTMDYAAVEIKSSNIAQMAEDELIASVEEHAADIRIGMGTHSVYVCKYCPKAFSASNYLITHMRRTHVCKFCTQTFIETVDLYAHIKQDHQTHQCVICGKHLSSHSNLRAHIRRMHGIQLPAQMAILGYRRASVEEEEQEVVNESEDIGEVLTTQIRDKEIIVIYNN